MIITHESVEESSKCDLKLNLSNLKINLIKWTNIEMFYKQNREYNILIIHLNFNLLVMLSASD